MTRHALAAHAPDGAIFGVSSFGPGAEGNRPPTELRPMGLEGPLSWLAEQLEARDRAAMIRDLGACPPRRLDGWSAWSPPTSGGIRDRTGPTSSATGSRRWRGRRRRGRLLRLAGCVAAGRRRRGRLRRPGIPPRPGVRARGGPRRAGDRAAMGRPAGMAPVAGRLLAVAGAPGPEQEGRVAGQGGRGPGRQRHRGPRPAVPARRPEGPGAPARARPSARSSRRRNTSGTTAAGRRSRARPARWPPSTTPPPRWPPSTASSASSPTRPDDPTP